MGQEKERERQDDNEEENSKSKETPKIQIDVTIHNRYIGKLTVRQGISLREALELIAKEHNLNLSEYRVILDGEEVQKNQNPILSLNSTLSLIKKIEGG